MGDKLEKLSDSLKIMLASTWLNQAMVRTHGSEDMACVLKHFISYMMQSDSSKWAVGKGIQTRTETKVTNSEASSLED